MPLKNYWKISLSKADSIKLYQGDDGLYYAEVYASEVVLYSGITLKPMIIRL